MPKFFDRNVFFALDQVHYLIVSRDHNKSTIMVNLLNNVQSCTLYSIQKGIYQVSNIPLKMVLSPKGSIIHF